MTKLYDQIRQQCADFGGMKPGRCLITERDWAPGANPQRCKLCPDRERVDLDELERLCQTAPIYPIGGLMDWSTVVRNGAVAFYNAVLPTLPAMIAEMRADKARLAEVEADNLLLSTCESAKVARQLRETEAERDAALAEIKRITEMCNRNAQNAMNYAVKANKLKAALAAERDVTDEKVERAAKAAKAQSSHTYHATFWRPIVRAALIAARTEEGGDATSYGHANLARSQTQTSSPPPQSHDQACGGEESINEKNGGLHDMPQEVHARTEEGPEGWTGNRCPTCEGHGCVADASDFEEKRCPACGGTGDEFKSAKNPPPQSHDQACGGEEVDEVLKEFFRPNWKHVGHETIAKWQRAVREALDRASVAKPARNSEADRISFWLAASLDDPKVCGKMKTDIRAWLSQDKTYMDRMKGYIERNSEPHPAVIAARLGKGGAA